MNTTSDFIKDRALSLACEARHFPQVSEAANKWLRLAIVKAQKRGDAQLVTARASTS